MKILIAPDKFKGSLTAQEVSNAIAKACRYKRPESQIDLHPLADGGEGSIDILADTLGLKYRNVEVRDPIDRKITSGYYHANHEAFVELASASGLALLLQKERNPMMTSTYGTGLLVRDAIKEGFREIYLFIGGSATNDAGLGIAAALGYVFLDKAGKTLFPSGRNLHKIDKILHKKVDAAIRKTRFTVLCDVKNPLYGSRGAAWVYAAQKGASPADITALDKGLQHIDHLFKTQLGKDISQLPGSGAAGGVGAGMVALFDAQLQSGIHTIMDLTGFERKAAKADLIITGEGQLDTQTLEGKVVKTVADIARRYKKPLIIIVGQNTLPNDLLTLLNTSQIFSVMDQAKDVDDAMRNASDIIARIVGGAL